MKFSTLFCFAILFTVNNCVNDFYFHDELINSILNDAKYEAIAHNTTKRASSSKHLVDHRSAEGSGDGLEGSGDSLEGSGDNLEGSGDTAIDESVAIGEETGDIKVTTTELPLTSLAETDEITWNTEDLTTLTENVEEVTESISSMLTDEIWEEETTLDSLDRTTDATDYSVDHSPSTGPSEKTEINYITTKLTVEEESTTVSSELDSLSSFFSPNVTDVGWTPSFSADIDSSTKEATQNNGALHKYVSIRVCTKDFVCKVDARGPCHANETLVVDDSSTADEFGLSCSAFYRYPWKNCVKAKRFGSLLSSVLPGKCVPIVKHSEPCDIHNKGNKRCLPVTKNRRAPQSCGRDQTFIGIPFLYGWCECMDRRFLPYFGDNLCYRPFTRGPCRHGDWLVPSRNRITKCQPCPCPEKADGRHIYWTGQDFGPAGCYRALTNGPCPDEGVFIVSDYISGKAYCSMPKY